MEWPLSTWRSRLHCGNAAHGVQDPRLREDDGVLGKVSRVDKRLRDSWNGNRLSESMRGVKTPEAEQRWRRVGIRTAWWYLHHLPNPLLDPSDQLNWVWTMWVCSSQSGEGCCSVSARLRQNLNHIVFHVHGAEYTWNVRANGWVEGKKKTLENLKNTSAGQLMDSLVDLIC